MFPQRGVGRQVILVIVPAFDFLWNLIQTLYFYAGHLPRHYQWQTNWMVEKHDSTYRLVIGCAYIS